MSEAVAITGVYQTKYGYPLSEQSLEELIFQAATGALVDAGLTIKDIDSVVIASSDQIDGRVISSMVTSGPAGCYYKDCLNVSSSGEHALILACLRIMSGLFDTSLVVSWHKSSEGSMSLVDTFSLDPFYQRPVGLNGVVAAALQAGAYRLKYKPPQELVAQIVVKNRTNALKNPNAHLHQAVTVDEVINSTMICWPLKELEVPPESDGACALVVASPRRAKALSKRPAWIKGIGWATDTYWLGDREASVLAPLAQAALRAYKMAGVDDPMAAFQLAEIYELSSYHELMAYEALGFCPIGKGYDLVEKGITSADGPLPVNPSGGALSSNPIFAAGLVRVAEVALQVMVRAEDRQVDGVNLALACSSSGLAGQGSSVFILGKET